MHALNNVSTVSYEAPVLSLPELTSLNKQFWQGWSCNPPLETIYSLYSTEKRRAAIILVIYFAGHM